jgi:acyl-CoA thioesterase FadM
MPSSAMVSTEHVISDVPVAVRRCVKFGGCDPAGVIYTVAFCEYVISAAGLFYGSPVANAPRPLFNELGLSTPTRGLEFDFRRPLWPDDEFDITISVSDIGTSTYVLDIDARTPERAEVFRAKLTPSGSRGMNARP